MQAQSGNSWQVTFAPQSQTSEELSDFLEQYFEVIACNYTEQEQEQYVGYLSHPLDEKDLQKSAKKSGIELPYFECEFIPATNWLTKNVIKFDPIETGDFLIYGNHEEQAPKSDKLAIRIYAATAFGSGQHQTTKSCLKLLSLLNSNGFRAKKILDMGSGSGILALAALKLWQEAYAVAADIDEEAVIVTMQNATDNDIAKRLDAFASNGYQNKQIANNAKYDLIFSNILARPLIEMAEELSNNLNMGGFAILSGFIDEQTDWVVNEHQKYGLKLLKVFEDENWRAVLMEKIQ